MSETDYVYTPGKPLKVVQDSTFDMQQLYQLGRSWFDNHGYDFVEKEYLSAQKEDTKNITLKWNTDRKIDDYVKFHIDVSVKVKNMREVQGKKKMMNAGEITIEVDAYIEKDYESSWEKGFMSKFMRSLYDTFVIKVKLEKDKERLEREAKEFFNEARTFLKCNPYR